MEEQLRKLLHDYHQSLVKAHFEAETYAQAMLDAAEYFHANGSVAFRGYEIVQIMYKYFNDGTNKINAFVPDEID